MSSKVRMTDFHYTQAQMLEALRQLGLKRGDVVFSHSNVGFFGIPEAGHSIEAAFDTVFKTFMEVLGEDGTLIVPTFTYSFCKGEVFDIDETPSTCGAFTEMLRKLPQARRSADPIFSVAAVGSRADEFTANVAEECFGQNSFWDRFLRADGIICNLNFDAGSTLIHFVEKCLNVPYRYDKLFPGVFCKDGKNYRGVAVFFCQDRSNPDTVAAFETFDKLARERQFARTANVGRGAVVTITARDTHRLIAETVPKSPYFLTTGGNRGIEPVLLRQPPVCDGELAENASMIEMIEALWKLPRDIVSDGYDVALKALATQVPMTIHEYPTGTACWTWIVPEKWTCHEAYLETLDGKRLFSYADNPLHVVSYSLPFEGEVWRQELFEHLHVHPRLPDAIPFKFRYYERDWGLCCSQELKDNLTQDRYKVMIESEFSYGTLKVGEVVVPGESTECIVLCAHLCHPAQVNDDLAGVVVGIDVMRELLKQQNLRYTYRLLIVPETIGSIAYLSHHEDLIPDMKGGLFLEMLGLDNPHTLQLSFEGNTELDQCFTLALKAHDPNGWTTGFQTMNDERQFNAPGVRVPMLALYRVLPASHPDWPYREYHSHCDTPELVSLQRLEASRDLVLRMIGNLEDNLRPVNKFRGEVFCSRYGLHIDWYANPEGNKALFDIMYRIDGTRSVSEIANACGISFEAAKKTIDQLRCHGLVG